jgi:hypothetical protein
MLPGPPRTLRLRRILAPGAAAGAKHPGAAASRELVALHFLASVRREIASRARVGILTINITREEGWVT